MGIKELQARIEELEEDLETERNNRAKADKLRLEISDEMELLCERLGEANVTIMEQSDRNKKLESEMNRMRRAADDIQMGHNTTLNNYKKKISDQINDLNE